MRLFVDIDDIGNCLTQAVVFDCQSRIMGQNVIYNFPFSLVENGETAYNSGTKISEEYVVHAKSEIIKIIKKAGFLSDFVQIMMGYSNEWDVLFRHPEEELVKDNKDNVYIREIKDSLENVGLYPQHHVCLPIISEYPLQKLSDQIFSDGHYVVITPSEYLATIASMSEFVHYIILVSRPWNSGLVSQQLETIGSDFKFGYAKMIIASDIIAALQTYTSILSYGQENGKDTERENEGTDSREGGSGESS